MRIVVAILLILAVNNSPARGEELPAPVASLELVPSVRHGHSVTWKTGAIITFASLGVTLAGVAFTIGGLQGVNFENGGSGGSPGMFWTGIAMSIAGDGGAFIGGPITWMFGIGGPRD